MPTAHTWEGEGAAEPVEANLGEAGRLGMGCAATSGIWWKSLGIPGAWKTVFKNSTTMDGFNKNKLLGK